VFVAHLLRQPLVLFPLVVRILRQPLVLLPELFALGSELLREPAELVGLSRIPRLEGAELFDNGIVAHSEFVALVDQPLRRIVLRLHCSGMLRLLRLELLVPLFDELHGDLVSGPCLLEVQRGALTEGDKLPCLGIEIKVRIYWGGTAAILGAVALGGSLQHRFLFVSFCLRKRSFKYRLYNPIVRFFFACSFFLFEEKEL
jgi:hypothetical protein